MDEIKELFKKRDLAVKKKDKDLFLSTQAEDIEYHAVYGYLSIEKLKTEILLDYKVDELKHVVFVKEEYYKEGKKSHEAFLLHHVINTVKGFKIYKIEPTYR